MAKLTEKIQIQKPLSNEQKEALWTEISNAYINIQKKDEELKAFKEAIKTYVETQQDIIDMNLTNYRLGYVPENIEVVVRYEKGMTKYFAVETGELVEEHPTTEDEQLRMSGNIVDAESVIRDSDS